MSWWPTAVQSPSEWVGRWLPVARLELGSAVVLPGRLAVTGPLALGKARAVWLEGPRGARCMATPLISGPGFTLLRHQHVGSRLVHPDRWGRFATRPPGIQAHATRALQLHAVPIAQGEGTRIGEHHVVQPRRDRHAHQVVRSAGSDQG